MLNGKDPALHDDGAHIQGQVLHSGCVAAEGLSVEGIAVLGLGSLLLGLVALDHGDGGQRLLTDLLHGIAELPVRKFVARLHTDGHIRGKPCFQRRCNGGDLLFHPRLPVGNQRNSQFIAAPCPFGSGKGTPGHGILLHEQASQLLRLHLGQLLGRMGEHNMEPVEAVELQQFFFQLLGHASGHIGFRMGRRFHRPRGGI